ncbi:MAG: ABC transporter permease [Desulfovibrio sp.]
MAWRNIWRNPRRSILTILAIGFACLLLVFMLSFQLGMYDVMINASVKGQTGHLQIFEENYPDDWKMRQVVEAPSKLEPLLDSIPEISGYTFRANGFALLSSDDRTYGGMVTGVDPIRESLISSTASTVREGKYLQKGDTNQAVIGSLLAKNLHVSVGDELVLLGSGRDGSVAASVLNIKGVFTSGIDDYDRSAIQIPLRFFQETYMMDESVHQIVIVCKSLDDVGSAQSAIIGGLSECGGDEVLECQSWDELSPGLIETIKLDLGGGIVFYAILVVVVAFSIMNTFLMAVFERTKEFGILLSIGAKPSRLTKMLLLESLFLTACGLLFGIIAGCVLTAVCEQTGIPMGEAEGMLRQYGIPSLLKPKLSLFSALAGPVVVFCITMLTALYPALKVHRLKPVDAMQAT